MSTTYHSYVIFGVLLTKDDLIRKTENPLWGKYKFDPETGRKVERFIVEHEIDTWDITEGTNLAAESTGYNSEGDTVVGKLVAPCLGRDGGGIQLLKMLDAEEMDIAAATIIDRLRKFDIHVADRVCGYYHVFYVG